VVVLIIYCKAEKGKAEKKLQNFIFLIFSTQHERDTGFEFENNGMRR
jgi:hypothetical protein